MAEWQKKFGAERLPTYYASQGYDTALAIAAALKATNGNVDEYRRVPRRRCCKADFQAVRGAFKFGPNQHPIQDWYATQGREGRRRQAGHQDGRQDLSDHGDAYSKDCKL